MLLQARSKEGLVTLMCTLLSLWQQESEITVAKAISLRLMVTLLQGVNFKSAASEIKKSK